MVDNYVEEIRNFIVENYLVAFRDVKSIALAPNRINLLMQSRVKPRDGFLNYQTKLFTKSVQEDEDEFYLVVISGLNTKETLDDIKKALLLF